MWCTDSFYKEAYSSQHLGYNRYVWVERCSWGTESITAWTGGVKDRVGKVKYYRGPINHMFLELQLADLFEPSEMCPTFSHLEAMYYKETNLKYRSCSHFSFFNLILLFFFFLAGHSIAKWYKFNNFHWKSSVFLLFDQLPSPANNKHLFVSSVLFLHPTQPVVLGPTTHHVQSWTAVQPNEPQQDVILKTASLGCLKN